MLPILFINLDSDTERCIRMQAELTRAGLVGERLAATRWTNLSQSEQACHYDAELNAKQFHKPLVNGEKGCYASHLQAWQWLLQTDYPAMVVLEDDVALMADFAAVIEALASQPPGWDMVKLIGRIDLGRPEKLSRSRPLLAGHSLVDYRRVPSLTAGYVLSRSGASKLLASRKPFGRPIDVDLRYWWENDLRIHGVVPAAIRLDDTSLQSSIGAKAPEVSLASKWRKFRLKAKYTICNRWHRLRVGR